MTTTTWQTRVFVVLLTTLGFAALGIAADELLKLAYALGRGDPVVAYWPTAAIALPIGVALLALAALPVVPEPAKPKRDWRVALMGLAVIGLLLAFPAAPIGRALAGRAAASHGYRPCPPLAFERPLHLRWSKPTARCPLGLG